MKPSSRREMALSAVMLSKAQTSHLSIRAACVAFSISETCYRYQPFCLSVISEATLPAAASLNRLRLDASATFEPFSTEISTWSNILPPNVGCGAWG